MASPQDSKKHPIIMHVHSMVRLYSSWLIAVVVFTLIFITGAQYAVRIGLTFAVIDTLCIVLAKWLFDQFFNSRFFSRSYTMLNIFVIFALITCMVSLMNLLEFLSCKVVLPDVDLDVEHIYTVVRDGFWIVGAFLASLVLWSEDNIARQETLISAKNDLELKLLRQQISPHFIFNALNNIYSLVYTKSDKAPEMILQLSDMLRYTVDLSQMDQVEVEKECNYIENYISFQRIRLGGDVPVHFTKDIRDASVCIPPMLLQPFVENCFIHGDLSEGGGRHADILVSVDSKRLVFKAENTKRSTPSFVRKKHESTGIANVRQRLQLYFNDAFTLDVNDTPDIFSVFLQIDFKPAEA